MAGIRPNPILEFLADLGENYILPLRVNEKNLGKYLGADDIRRMTDEAIIRAKELGNSPKADSRMSRLGIGTSSADIYKATRLAVIHNAADRYTRMNFLKILATGQLEDRLNDRFKGAKKYNSENVIPIEYLYSDDSRLVPSTEGAYGVRLADKTKGWIDEEGNFLSEEGALTILSHIEATTFGRVMDMNLQEMFRKLFPKDKAKVVSVLLHTDWDAFWNEIGSPIDDDTDLTEALNHQERAIHDLFERMGFLLHWDA